MPLFQALSLNYIKHILQKMSSYAMHFPIDLRIESRCAAHHGDLRRLLAWVLGGMLSWRFRFSYPTVLLLGDAAKLTRKPK